MRALEVWLAEHRFALPVGAIDEVLPLVDARPLPSAPLWIVGMAQLRGAFVPLIDCGLLLNDSPVKRTMNTRIILLQTGAAGGALRLALLVDEVGGVITLNPETAGTHAGLEGVARGALGAMMLDATGEITLIEITRLLSDSDRKLFRDSMSVA